MTNSSLIQQLKKWLQQVNRENVNLDIAVDDCYETFVLVKNVKLEINQVQSIYILKLQYE